MGENTPTFRLFARPSLVGGIARLLDFGGTLNVYNDSHTPELADLNAFSSDAAALAQDGSAVNLETARASQVATSKRDA